MTLSEFLTARLDEESAGAEVEVKRRIIAKRAELEAFMEANDPLGMNRGDEGGLHALDWVMREMASVYSDHPDHAAAVAWFHEMWPT